MTTVQNKYELMLILLPDLGDEGTKTELEEVRKLIAEGKGEISHEDIWGARELEYRIRKQDEGFYVVLNFSISPLKISELEKALNIHNSILRFLILKTVDNYKIKTFQEYKVEGEKADKEEKERKDEIESKKQKKMQPPVRKPAPAPTVASAPAPAPKAEPKAEPKKVEEEEKAEPKKPKKVAQSKLEEVDEKLKSIINDPDISL